MGDITAEGQITLEEFTLQILKAVCPLMKICGLTLAGLRLLQADIDLLSLLHWFNGNQTVNWVVEVSLRFS